ncbi:hypothetical protein [Vagococcus zengguangii]|uniref:Uncharacterized protein n=1 Tax=Vagococcus zengguangii TaxID=2571750 RepID=A0A4D7CUD8_9ENTE|nr:hypothetical protein [Vagococcus zengguangii]QCI85951.1 hypothetical protein FA707_02785 [Vagococcus zengguangii]TLG80304.1 hypothetical protein FE258_06360 [Vagococcus zengguangii]
MKEALKRLQEAEKDNLYKKEQLIESLNHYEEEKKQLLADERQLVKKELTQLVKEKEQLEQRRMEKEELRLKEKNMQLKEQLIARYAQNNQEAVQAIIERVKQTYGRH